MTTTIRQANEKLIARERIELALAMTPAQIAAEIRAELKAEYPEWKFSVSARSFAGGFEINVSLLEGPRDVFMVDTLTNATGYTYKIDGHLEINEYNPQFMDGILTKEAARIMRNVIKIINLRNWDHSDIQSDYFDVHYFTTISIGRYDRHYTIR